MRRVSQTLPHFKDKRDHCNFVYYKYYSPPSVLSPPLWLNSQKLHTHQRKGDFYHRGRESTEGGEKFVEEMRAKKVVHPLYLFR